MKRFFFLLLLLPALLPVLLLTACSGDEPDLEQAEQVKSFRDLRILFVDSLDNNLTDRTRVTITDLYNKNNIPFAVETFRGQRCIRFAATLYPVDIVVNGRQHAHIYSSSSSEVAAGRKTTTIHYLYNNVNTGDSVATLLCLSNKLLLRHYAPELKFRLIFPRVPTHQIPKDNPCRLNTNIHEGPLHGMPDTQGRFISMDTTPIDDHYSKVTLLMGATVQYGVEYTDVRTSQTTLHFMFESQLFPYEDHRFKVIVDYIEDLFGHAYHLSDFRDRKGFAPLPCFNINGIRTQVTGGLSFYSDVRQVVKPDNVIEIEMASW